ncbi:MAG: DUF6677 family protein [Phycisphaeraceae bacterium]|nr:DUF6677 family protein [Phycisphaeraceae bacterium]
MNDSASTSDPSFRLLAGLSTWALPGLGHLLIGRRRTGWLAGSTILLLWIGGLLIGGISVIDSQGSGDWFVRIGQYLMGPSGLVDLAHQWLRGSSAGPGPDTWLTPALGRAREQGVLYTGLAGYLNLLLALDVLLASDPQPQTRAAS